MSYPGAGGDLDGLTRRLVEVSDNLDRHIGEEARRLADERVERVQDVADDYVRRVRAAAEQEVARLEAVVAELRRQLSSAQTQRDRLLADVTRLRAWAADGAPPAVADEVRRVLAGQVRPPPAAPRSPRHAQS